jgi:hypothetical protein
MKSFLLRSFLLTVFSVSAFMQARADVFDELATAIRSGNASAVARYFNSSVELNIQNSEGVYSKSQAEMILKDFMSKHPVQKFNIVHRGSAGGSLYAIANYTAGDGNYRCSIFVKEVNGQMLIHEIKFEKE